MTIDPTTVPSARQYREPSPIFAPTAAKASPNPIRSSCRRAVRKDRQAGSDLAQRRGLLENHDVDAPSAEGACRGEAANSSPDDGGTKGFGRPGLVFHLNLRSFPRWPCYFAAFLKSTMRLIC